MYRCRPLAADTSGLAGGIDHRARRPAIPVGRPWGLSAALGPVDDEPDVMSGTCHVPMSQVFDGAVSPTQHYYEIKGRAAEIARALGSPAGGAEHLFLGMLHDGGWPVNVISGLVDFGRAETAVLGIVNGPGYSPPPPPRFPMREGHVWMWARRSPSKWAIPISAWSTRFWP